MPLSFTARRPTPAHLVSSEPFGHGYERKCRYQRPSPHQVSHPSLVLPRQQQAHNGGQPNASGKAVARPVLVRKEVSLEESAPER